MGNKKLDDYPRTHRALDVTDRNFLPTIKKLFAHAARTQGKSYFEALHNSVDTTNASSKLILVIFYCNDRPLTSKMFTRHENMPTDYNDARLLLKKSSQMLALFRGTNVISEVEQVMADFPKLCVHEPTIDMFVDPRTLITTTKVSSRIISSSSSHAQPGVRLRTGAVMNASRAWASFSSIPLP